MRLLHAFAFFLAGMSPLIFYGVSAQSSAATCTASLQALQAACGTDTSTVATCCPVYKAQVNAYPDCYCSLNSTILLQLATTCSFTLPQNLTSCFTAATPPPPSPPPSLMSPPPPPSLMSPPPPPSLMSPPPPPSLTSPPPPPTTTTCDVAWQAILTACNTSLTQCCNQISSSMTNTPSCYCEFTSLNTTTFYRLVGPDYCDLAVPPVVSACVAALSPPPPPPLKSPPPPSPTPLPSSPPPTTTTTTRSSPPPPSTPVATTSSSSPPPPSSSLISGANSLPTPTQSLLIIMLVPTLLLPFFM